MKRMYKSLSSVVGAILLSLLVSVLPAGAFEAHNFIEPPFGSFRTIGGLAVDPPSGEVYGAEREYGHGEVAVFGSTGGAPSGGPASFTGAGSFQESFVPSSVAVYGANATIYVGDQEHAVVDKYKVSGSGEYEYVCQLKYYGAGDRCLPDGGQASESTAPTCSNGEPASMESSIVAVDSSGDLYVGGRDGCSEGAIFEFGPGGEALQLFGLPEAGGQVFVESLAVSANGTIYAQVYRGAQTTQEVLELRRSSSTGPVEGEPSVVSHTLGATGVAYDDATSQLFVDMGTYGQALNGAQEVVSRFGTGVIERGNALAVDEATGEVYVADRADEKIERFGPGVPATVPLVDQPPPSASAVTRTSALLSGTVETGDATSSWHLEYVAAGEYDPTAANPYAGGGSSGSTQLAASPTGTTVGPVPLTGLLAGTTYHYRIVASNEVGTTYGADHEFTTSAATPPLVSTGAPLEVTQTSVTLTGVVDPRELQTSYELEVGTDTSYDGAKLFGNAGSGAAEAIAASLQYLIPGTTYHYRLVASNEDGTSYGQDMTFTTPGVSAPIVQPVALQMLPSPPGAFPSVAGAITKGRSAKPRRAKPRKHQHKPKHKPARRTRRPRRAAHGEGRQKR